MLGCDAIGVNIKQGLKDLWHASDLVEALNNVDRPPRLKDRRGQPRDF